MFIILVELGVIKVEIAFACDSARARVLNRASWPHLFVSAARFIFEKNQHHVSAFSHLVRASLSYVEGGGKKKKLFSRIVTFLYARGLKRVSSCGLTIRQERG